MHSLEFLIYTPGTIRFGIILISKNITVLISKKGKGRNLTADSKRVIASLDLSQFNVIDCDSYGIPFDVLVKIFNNPTLKKDTVIIYTAITNSLSGLNSECLKMYGLNKIYCKCQHLIAAHALDLFYGMLQRYGIKDVSYYELTGNFTKHYGYFTAPIGGKEQCL